MGRLLFRATWFPWFLAMQGLWNIPWRHDVNVNGIRYDMNRSGVKWCFHFYYYHYYNYLLHSKWESSSSGPTTSLSYLGTGPSGDLEMGSTVADVDVDAALTRYAVVGRDAWRPLADLGLENDLSVIRLFGPMGCCFENASCVSRFSPDVVHSRRTA